MNATLLVLHILAIVHGTLAGLATFCLFTLVGLGLLPRTWAEKAGVGHGAMGGAVVYVLLCWYGIRAGVPIPSIAMAFAVLALLLAVRVRARLGAAWRDRARLGAITAWIGLFAGLYTLAYIVTLPPVTGESLPVAWTGNIDLLIYLDYTNYLRYLSVPQPLDLYLASKDFVYKGLPALYHLLGGFSMFYGAEALRAAMPLQFALTALAGVLAARIARRVFNASPLGAGVIAAVTVTGSFFRFVAANYYLSTLMAIPVLLHFLEVTVTYRPAPRALDPKLALSAAAHSLLLLFLYPFMLVTGLLFQAGVVGLSVLAALQGRGDRALREAFADALREAWRRSMALLVGLLVMTALVPTQVGWAVQLVRDFSQASAQWGWPLNVISPLALLGFPLSFASLPVGSTSLQPWAVGGICLIGLGLLAASFWRGRRTSVEQRVFAGLAALGFLAYACYFRVVGPSYQQWKMASYIVLPLTFVVTAVLLGLLNHLVASLLHGRPALAATTAAGLFVLVGLAMVGGNVAVHAVEDPPLRRFPGGWRNLAAVDALPSFRDVAIAAPDRATGMLAAYLLPHKRVHVLGPEFYPPISFDDASALRPILVPDYGCEGIGHGDTRTVAGVGCLLFAPPSLVADAVYPFSRNFLFVQGSGLGAREGWGRWNDGERARIFLRVDRNRITPDRDGAYLNLSLQPYRVPGLPGQRLRLVWGDGRAADILLAEQEWVSLPLAERDWGAARLVTQVVSIEMLDARVPHAAGTDPRPLAVGFLGLSLSARPSGRAITPQR